MVAVIFLLCCGLGFGLFWLCVRPFTRTLGLDDIRTSRKYLPGVYPSTEEKRR